ncbi:MAG: cadherin-like beta sandwich domain-containing protein [Clostridia bacterium]|nr:cadherin-like beta sandwich domain-containing protein [Clostridia bacterium]
MKNIKKIVAVLISICFATILSITAFAEPTTEELKTPAEVPMDNRDAIVLYLFITPSEDSIVETVNGQFTVTPSNPATQVLFMKAAGFPNPTVEATGAFKTNAPFEGKNMLMFTAAVTGEAQVGDTFTFTATYHVKENGSDTVTTFNSTKTVTLTPEKTTTTKPTTTSPTTVTPGESTTGNLSSSTTKRPSSTNVWDTTKKTDNTPEFTLAPVQKVPVYTVAETTDAQSAIRIDKDKSLLLKSLRVNGGLYPLNPDFDPTIPYYVVEIPSGISALDVQAKAKDPKAIVTVDGADKLVPNEDNLISIVVETETGEKTEYTIKVKFNDKAASGKTKVIFPTWMIATFGVAIAAVAIIIIVAIVLHVKHMKAAPQSENAELMDSLLRYNPNDDKK